MRHTTKMSSKGQMVVPQEIRERLGLQPGDALLVEIKGERMIVEKRPKSWTEWGFGLHKEVWRGVDARSYVRRERTSWSKGSR